MPARSRSAVTSGRRGLTCRPARPPATAPAPQAADSTPQAAAPPSERAAMTGPMTNRAGMTKLPQAWASRLTQYQGRMTSSCQPSARSARNGRTARQRPGRHPQPGQAGQAHEEGGRVGGEQPARPEDRDQHAADGGAGHAEEAQRQAEQAVGLLQLLSGHGLRHEGGRGGIEEGRRRTVERFRDAELPDVRVPAQQQDRQRRLDRPADRVGGKHHVLPSQPVGPHPAGQQAADLGDGLDREDDADVGGRPPDVQDREQQRDLHYRVTQHGGSRARPHQPEVRCQSGRPAAQAGARVSAVGERRLSEGRERPVSVTAGELAR